MYLSYQLDRHHPFNSHAPLPGCGIWAGHDERRSRDWQHTGRRGGGKGRAWPGQFSPSSWSQRAAADPSGRPAHHPPEPRLLIGEPGGVGQSAREGVT